MRGLRVFDTQPWPNETLAEMTVNKWAFCFLDVPWFPAVLTPAHTRGHSRDTPNLVFVMQAKWIFNILFNTLKKCYAACEKVRALVTEFGDVLLSPEVAHYGEPGTTEGRQYSLLDENQRSHCPYPDLIYAKPWSRKASLSKTFYQASDKCVRSWLNPKLASGGLPRIESNDCNLCKEPILTDEDTVPGSSFIFWGELLSPLSILIQIDRAGYEEAAGSPSV